jgi:hypothetical protein
MSSSTTSAAVMPTFVLASRVFFLGSRLGAGAGMRKWPFLVHPEPGIALVGTRAVGYM